MPLDVFELSFLFPDICLHPDVYLRVGVWDARKGGANRARSMFVDIHWKSWQRLILIPGAVLSATYKELPGLFISNYQNTLWAYYRNIPDGVTSRCARRNRRPPARNRRASSAWDQFLPDRGYRIVGQSKCPFRRLKGSDDLTIVLKRFMHLFEHSFVRALGHTSVGRSPDGSQRIGATEAPGEGRWHQCLIT